MSKLFQKSFVFGLLLFSSIALVCFGILSFGRGGYHGFDFEIMYHAGRGWLAGINPYDQSEFRKLAAVIEDAPFSYPPTSAFFFVPLGLLSFAQADAIWLLINLVALASIVTMSILIMRPFARANGDSIGLWVVAAAIISNPMTTNVIWQGQTSLISLAGTMGAWLLSRQRRWLLAGICLAIAALKPQLCIYVIIWFLLERQWKMFGVAAGITVLMSLYPMVTQGSIRVFQQWIVRLQTHSNFPANQPGFEHVIGLQSLFHAAGLRVPNLILLGLILVVVMWFFRQELWAEDYLGMLMALTLLFVFNSDSAYVCIVPIFTSLFLHSYHERKLLLSTIILGLVLIFPRRIVRIIDTPVMYHWRTVVILILLALLTKVSLDYQSRRNLTQVDS